MFALGPGIEFDGDGLVCFSVCRVPYFGESAVAGSFELMVGGEFLLDEF